MKISTLYLIWFALPGSLLPSFIAHGEPRLQSHIPALLQFAEQYQVQPIPEITPKVAPPCVSDFSKLAEKKVKSPTAKASINYGSWQIKDTELQRQRETITQLKRQLSSLQEQVKSSAAMKVHSPAVDWQSISQLAKNLRQALTISPSEQQAAEQIKQAQQESALALKNEQNARTELATFKSKNSELQQQLILVKSESEHLNKSHNDLSMLQKSSAIQITELLNDLKELEVRAPLQVSAEHLKIAKTRQDYAAGISLGEEILNMQAERDRWGVQTDKQLILAGITDAFAGERRLSDDVLNIALTEAENEVIKAREKMQADQTNTDDDFLEKFKQDEQVKQATGGGWYKIDYSGDIPIAAGSIVDVVVKEMLTDGTVIQDMETSGVTLSQPVADFPPLFKEAISQLKNHGSMTLVVPPALAYGEKGFPPKVPPHATMVYQLRIAEMYPQEDKRSTRPMSN